MGPGGSRWEDDEGHSLKVFVGAVALGAALAGCAASPETIAPSYVSEVGYRSWACKDLAEESGRLSSALSRTSQLQENARTGDTVGIILLGLPTASMSGQNVAPEVARLKGEAEAVRKAMIGKRCSTT